jgi:hypothetical protein
MLCGLHCLLEEWALEVSQGFSEAGYRFFFSTQLVGLQLILQGVAFFCFVFNYVLFAIQIFNSLFCISRKISKIFGI